MAEQGNKRYPVDFKRDILTYQLIEFHGSGSADPEPLTLSGTTAAGTDTIPSVLTTIWAQPMALAPGGTELLFHVDDAEATEYSNATNTTSPTSPDMILGTFRDGTAARTGSTFAFTESTRGGICGGKSSAVVVDTATGAISIPSVPSTGGGIAGFWVEGL